MAQTVAIAMLSKLYDAKVVQFPDSLHFLSTKDTCKIVNVHRNGGG